ncbi:muscle-specific protein 20-like [Lingula anatina]|nr:muscle-specific protein 20-like [Lingula anatina]|eukprot:XP_013387823.1 muscle-specific protein 20-like [Lingula anatina]
MDQALEALAWIEAVTGRPLLENGMSYKDQFEVMQVLKDGEALCELVNAIAPGIVKKINRSKLAFKQMENIELFLTACKQLGMKDVDVFQTQDLYEGKNMYIVINCIHILGSLAQKHDFQGPVIGVKLADMNKRNFGEEKLKAGQHVIGLQMGTNKGASQAGMTAYGMTRHM